MASGASHVTGVVMGTGVAIDVTGEKCGFKPSRVEIENKTGLCKASWSDTMADAAAQKIVDSGAGATDVVNLTSNGITPLSGGFRIGADADLNVSGEAIHFVAWQ